MARFDKSSTKRPKQDAAVAASRSAKRSTAPSIEDTMFFPRLRRHAKWMFVFLAVALGGGFVLFGVGAGGTGVGDILRGGGGSSGVPSVSNAQKKTEKNPKDVAAWRELSTALQTDGQTDQAIAAQKQVVVLAPKEPTRSASSQASISPSRPQAARRPAGVQLRVAYRAPAGLPRLARRVHRPVARRRQDQLRDQRAGLGGDPDPRRRRTGCVRPGGRRVQEDRRAPARRPERPARARPGGPAGGRHGNGDRRLHGLPQARPGRPERVDREAAAEAAETDIGVVGIDSPAG